MNPLLLPLQNKIMIIILDLSSENREKLDLRTILVSYFLLSL